MLPATPELPCLRETEDVETKGLADVVVAHEITAFRIGKALLVELGELDEREAGGAGVLESRVLDAASVEGRGRQATSGNRGGTRGDEHADDDGNGQPFLRGGANRREKRHGFLLVE